MGIVSYGISALSKLAIVALLLAAFIGAMATVVYMSLSGEEVTVPEITGKDFFDSEKELASLGLKIKRRADRPSTEKMNTVLEQLPKPGETVKTGQLIFVVVSKAGVEGEEAPKSPIKNLETDDSEKIKEMISDKPKKPKTNSNSNANAKKKTDPLKDADDGDETKAGANNSNTKPDDNDKKGKDTKSDPGDKDNKNTSTRPVTKPLPTPAKPAAKDPRARNSQRP